ncbi:DUF2314 domain-containing protein [Melittangium boletus]|uniref:DUF2314 domain-containing protein n=1 Tax=Melittangium boletus DSM 14713 TaxID=1294270 RepID=A0A250IPD0_9BACT|nr:DUF2314 domain-containing protein [Melittangium boletus]ATB33113.1 hypothetical protein MEBOL_006602 [Melittangium boletus DSM 14713]
MKEVYLVALESDAPVPSDALAAAFEIEELAFTPSADGPAFTVEAEDARVEVVFESRPAPQEWTADLFSGSEPALEALGRARSFYRLAFELSPVQPTVPVFAALVCARVLLAHSAGVLVDITSSKVHESDDVAEITELDFDIRDHVNLHAVEVIEGETPLWVHSHGMEKFGARDLEIFHLGEQDLLPAEAFLHELCTDLAFGQGPPLRTQMGTSEGQAFMLVPSEEARNNLLGVPLDAFEGHEGLFLTVVSPQGRHNTAELLRPFRERFVQEPTERTETMHQESQALLPAFKARLLRRGLMEPLTFLVRAPFETHPEGRSMTEQLWLEVLSWDDAVIVGRLVDGAVHTTEWRKGAHVEVPEADVNALALSREGRTLEDEEVRALLVAERPM